jgi:hypothetical protein
MNRPRPDPPPPPLPRLRPRPLPWVMILLLLSVLLPGCADGSSGSAAEAGRYSLTVITEQEHTFGDDQVNVGPLVVAGGTVIMAPGAEQRGTVLALAGELVVEGTVDGDLLALGGDVSLTDGSVVTGDVQQAGGSLEVSDTADVEGRLTTDAEIGQVLGGGSAERTSLPGVLLQLVLTVLLAAAAAAVIARLAPRPTRRVQAAATEHPVVSGALGTLVLVTTPALVVSMVFTLLLIPLALVVLVLLGGVVLYGLIGLGRGFGARLVASRRTLGPAGEAALGTGVLVAAMNVVALVPLLGPIVLVLVGAVATGAAMLTGLGTRTYTPPDDPDTLGEAPRTRRERT